MDCAADDKDPIMTLREAMLSSAEYKDDEEDEPLVYALSSRDSWEPNTLCCLIEKEGKIVAERDGHQLYYFLGSGTINEVVEGWRENISRTEVTEDEIVRVVIYYALNDAWPQPE